MGQNMVSAESVLMFRQALVNEERSPATIEKYMRDVRRFVEYAAGRELTKELVISFKGMLAEQYAPASVNSMLAAVNRFLKSMGRFDCTVRAIRIQRQSFRDRERELSREEYYHLLSCAKKQGQLRLYYVMQTICATGIRVSELCFITLEALNKGYALVQLKGKNRKVLLPEMLRRELKKYAKRCMIRSGSIFVTRSGKPLDRSNILHAMKKLCSEAGVDSSKVFPHNLRHLFACQFYQAYGDICRLADILGHSSINTTRIYTSVSGAEHCRQIDRLDLVIKSTA